MILLNFMRYVNTSHTQPDKPLASDVVISIEATNDHTCEIESEAHRIKLRGGIIRQAFNSGPERVWKKGRDEPGLAMTRSIGDHIARDIGVIATPEVYMHTIDPSDKEIITSGKFVIFLTNSIQSWQLLVMEYTVS